MYTINFLEKRRKQLSKLEKQDRQILKMSAIGFGVIGVIALGLLGARLFFQSTLSALEERQQTFEREVMSHEDTEEAFLFYVSKLETLQTLFKERENKQAAIDYFSQVFGSEVVIQNISYDANNANITFGLSAKDVFTLDGVFEVLSSEQTKALFKQVERNDLRRGAEGMYTVQVIVTFGDDQT